MGLFAPQAFAAAPGMEEKGTEVGSLPTLRFIFQGSKKIMCVNVMALRDHMNANDQIPKSPKEIFNAFANMSASAVGIFNEANPSNPIFPQWVKTMFCTCRLATSFLRRRQTMLTWPAGSNHLFQSARLKSWRHICVFCKA